MKENQAVYNTLGKFRDRQFYRGMVEIDGYEANIFVIDQLMSKMSEEQFQRIWIDATFNVSPLFSSQLLIIFGEIHQMVRLVFLNYKSKNNDLIYFRYG